MYVVTNTLGLYCKVITILTYPILVKRDLLLQSDQTRVLKCLPISLIKFNFLITQFQLLNPKKGASQQLAGLELVMKRG